VLRDVLETDLPIFFEQQRDPEAGRMAAFPARTWDAFLTHWRTRVLVDPRGRVQTVVVDGQVAGHVVRWEQDGQRLVGYWLGREFWGRGVATAALREFLTGEAARPLVAHVAAHNLGSIRVLEKCGFHREGASRGDDGVDELLFRLAA
jgi:RimJ/RimL family protein N-acetyltransferase